MEKNSSERLQTDGGDACERGNLSMKTPDRNRIAAAANAVSQFEDSPVFNYINSLSPIKTVKSLCTSQTFNSCSFSSLPAIFSSPHMNSLKDPRLLRRCYSSDSSKPEFSCQTENKVGHKEVMMDVDVSNEQPENFESCIEPTYECSELASQISGSLSYDCGTPETQRRSDLASTSGSHVPFLMEAGERGQLGVRGSLEEEARSIELNKEGMGGDWEMISDAADFLIFESPNNAEGIMAPCQKLTDSITRFCALVTQDDIDNIENTEAAMGTVEIEGSVHNQFSQSEDNHTTVAATSPNKYATEEISEEANNELASSFQRGGRRRCLTFDMSGIHKRQLGQSSNSGSAMSSKSDASNATKSTQALPTKSGNSSSFCILPGIGLHLNAIARTTKENTVVSQETFVNSQESGNKHVTSVGQNIGPHESGGVHSTEDACQTTLGDAAHDESNNTSPRKKRPRVQNAGEPESCKRCNCKKSKCLKLYCECFAAGVYCVEPCSCQECFNKPIHEDTVLATRKQIESRNPLAFAPKVIRTSDAAPETGDESNKTPASARHKRGCNCKKSGCLKKYCECYQGGVGCSINCRCEGCKNAFGTKDASILTEAELDEENEACEKNGMERSLHKNVHPNGVDRIQDSVPATPLRSGRACPDLSFSSKSKPPRSSFLSIGSSTGFYGSQTFGKPNFLQHHPMFEKRNHEAETPEILLQGNGGGGGGGVKSSSPNSKRVSPPHLGSSSASGGGRKSSRKLILQSIPSFPSLTPKP